MKFYEALEYAKTIATEKLSRGVSPYSIRLFFNGEDTYLEVDAFGNVSFEYDEYCERRYVLFCIDDLNSDGWSI